MPYQTLAEYRMAVARAAKSVRYMPTRYNLAALDAARQDLAEANLTADITRVLAAAPQLRPDQLDRLTALIRPQAEPRSNQNPERNST